jgi:hypothetical protein
MLPNEAIAIGVMHISQHRDGRIERELMSVTARHRDSDEYWHNPHLEILDIDWPALKHGIPAGLLRARNLRALATRVNVAQLGSVLWHLPAFERLEYLAVGYTDLSRAQLARLCDGLPRTFISCDYIDDKSESGFPDWDKLWDVDKSLDRRRFTEALSALDDMMSSVNLRSTCVVPWCP